MVKKIVILLRNENVIWNGTDSSYRELKSWITPAKYSLSVAFNKFVRVAFVAFFDYF